MKKCGIVLTFDDGFKTDLTVALQEQIDRGMTPKGTSFIIGSAGGISRLTNEEKLELFEKGWDLQCHSYTHTLGGSFGGSTGLTPQEMREEMINVEEHFKEVGLPKPIVTAYPGGGNSPQLRHIWGGFRKMLITTQPKVFDDYVDLKRVPRFSGQTESGLNNVKKAIDFVVENGGYITVMFHELGSEELVGRYKELLDYIQFSGIRMLNAKELYYEIFAR